MGKDRPFQEPEREAEVEKNNNRHPQEGLQWHLGVDGFVWLSLYPEKTNGRSPSIARPALRTMGLKEKAEGQPGDTTYHLGKLRLASLLPSFLSTDIYLLCICSWVWDISASKMGMELSLKVLRI